MTNNFKRGSRLGSARQKGNALVFAMLGLVITGLIAAANLEPTRAAQKAQAGFVEATILQSLRNATNEAIYENVAALQAGNPFIKAGVTVAPVTALGPALLTVIVQLTAAPGTGAPLVSTFVIARSTVGTTAVLSVALLFARDGSV